MIPFDFSRSVINAASDFEEVAERIAAEFELDAEELKQRAADYSAVSLVSPIEALHHVASLRGDT